MCRLPQRVACPSSVGYIAAGGNQSFIMDEESYLRKPPKIKEEVADKKRSASGGEVKAGAKKKKV